MPIGLAVGRLSPRRVGPGGVALMGGAFALLGTATGSMTNWLLLWALLAFAAFWVQTTVDLGDRQPLRGLRGLAFADAAVRRIAGRGGLPPLATTFIDEWGWRGADFPALSAVWGGSRAGRRPGFSSVACRIPRWRGAAARGTTTPRGSETAVPLPPRLRPGRPAGPHAAGGAAFCHLLQTSARRGAVRVHHAGHRGPPRSDPATRCRTALLLAGTAALVGVFLDRRAPGGRRAAGPLPRTRGRGLRLLGADPGVARRC